MRECRRPPNNCPSREELPKMAFPVVPDFLEPKGMKTPLIIALYAAAFCENGHIGRLKVPSA